MIGPRRVVAAPDRLLRLPLPWCYNAAVRLERLEEGSTGRWSSPGGPICCAPSPIRAGRSKFRAPTRARGSRRRVEPGGDLPDLAGATPARRRISIPPHLLAKAAASLGGDAFRRIHRALLEAYFGHSRDVTDGARCARSGAEPGCPRRTSRAPPSFLEQTLAEHAEAVPGSA